MNTTTLDDVEIDIVEIKSFKNRTFTLDEDFESYPLIFICDSCINLFGNIFVISIIILSKTFRKPANFLIANLSLASILYMVSISIRRLEDLFGLWFYSDPLCKLLTIFHKLPITLISLTTLMISYERRIVIRNPLSNLTKWRVLKEIIEIWFFSLIILIPLGMTRDFDEESKNPFQCKRVFLLGSPIVNIVYGVFFLLIIHVIPALILLFDMCRMLSTMKTLTLCQVKVCKIQDRRSSLMRNSCVHAVTFIICWLPLGLFRFPLDLPTELFSQEFLLLVNFYWELFRLVAFFQISLNPFLLFILSHDLRKFFSFQCNTPD